MMSNNILYKQSWSNPYFTLAPTSQMMVTYFQLSNTDSMRSIQMEGREEDGHHRGNSKHVLHPDPEFRILSPLTLPVVPLLLLSRRDGPQCHIPRHK